MGSHGGSSMGTTATPKGLMASNYLGIPTSSVPIERLFSRPGSIWSLASCITN